CAVWDDSLNGYIF
nr:immunoglobulin light chain junction region [Macaca mulatta]MPO04797.1 immunoglobulin light chain junction region [Macaca mulatta]MPO05257.1 immunoglobulin light chain junction region [Macaca mulatta]MPO05516.1 immunoglobulin light chain junction region [Macaca mulatta]MPO05984.1 immunoglobulin light chain junction region [Macaca mulatta]